MDLGLKNKRVIVTGATKGIGRAIADTFADEGADVAICARDAEEVAVAVKELASRGVRATGRAVDVSDGPALKSWVADVAKEFGGIDAVVANVSALAIGPSEENWVKSFETDILGAVRLVEASMEHLERSDSASIVTIASVSAREIDFASGSYGACKAALVHYTQGLAYHLAGKAIRANTVSPGNTYFPGGVWSQIEKGNPEFFATALAMNPMGRMGTPQEMANAAVFLSSPRASFITGTNLVVDGALSKGVQL